jgi:hypothetical protein
VIARIVYNTRVDTMSTSDQKIEFCTVIEQHISEVCHEGFSHEEKAYVVFLLKRGVTKIG